MVFGLLNAKILEQLATYRGDSRYTVIFLFLGVLVHSIFPLSFNIKVGIKRKELYDNFFKKGCYFCIVFETKGILLKIKNIPTIGFFIVL